MDQTCLRQRGLSRTAVGDDRHETMRFQCLDERRYLGLPAKKQIAVGFRHGSKAGEGRRGQSDRLAPACGALMLRAGAEHGLQQFAQFHFIRGGEMHALELARE